MKDKFDRLDEFILGNTSGNYSAAYLDHALKPRNAGSRDSADGYASLSARDGSAMQIWLRIDNGTVTDASFWTDGCGSTIACGSMTTELAKGKTLEQAFQLTPEEVDTALGGLPGEGCTCAKLAVDTLKAALRDYLAYNNEPWKRPYRRV